MLLSLAQTRKIYALEAKTEFLKFIRMPGFAIPALLFPIMFYVFFALIINPSNSASAATYLLATYGVFGIMGPALFSFGVNVAIEREQGWFSLKQLSPMPISAYIIARIYAAMCFSVIMISALFILAYQFGQADLSIQQWSLLAITLLLGTIPFCIFGLAIGLSISGQAAPAVVNLIYLPMSFLAGLWLPISAFPNLLQELALLLPSYHLAQIALKIIGADEGQSMLMHGGYLLIFTLLVSYWAKVTYQSVNTR